MANRSQLHPWANHPELLTSIRTPREKYQKAEWNFRRFEDEVLKRPCDAESVMYSALDFCVTIVGLRDWTKKALTRDVRHDGKALPSGLATLDDFPSFVAQKVPWQAAIEAIANTTKHAQYRDEGWPSGVAMPSPFCPQTLKDESEACENVVEHFHFMNRHSDVTWWDVALRQHPSGEPTPGHVAFGDALEGWGVVLNELGYQDD